MGWIIYRLIFGNEDAVYSANTSISLFPLGSLHWNTGVIITTVVAGILNTSNTFGSLKGSDSLVGEETTKKDYLTSFSFTGLATVASGGFGLVPYAPFVSSIGFLSQTEIYERMHLVIERFIFFIMGDIQPVCVLFTLLPLNIVS